MTLLSFRKAFTSMPTVKLPILATVSFCTPSFIGPLPGFTITTSSIFRPASGNVDSNVRSTLPNFASQVMKLPTRPFTILVSLLGVNTSHSATATVTTTRPSRLPRAIHVIFQPFLILMA